MQADDFQKFHDGIAGVMGFYGKSVSTFALDVWWTALKKYDLAAIVDAFNRHLANPDAGSSRPNRLTSSACCKARRRMPR